MRRKTKVEISGCLRCGSKKTECEFGKKRRVSWKKRHNPSPCLESLWLREEEKWLCGA